MNMPMSEMEHSGEVSKIGDMINKVRGDLDELEQALQSEEQSEGGAYEEGDEEGAEPKDPEEPEEDSGNPKASSVLAQFMSKPKPRM